MAKHFIFAIKSYFELRTKNIKDYTYGYFLADNGYLTSFAARSARRSFEKIYVCHDEECPSKGSSKYLTQEE